MFEGVECGYLEENTEKESRWSCGLRHELGDWDLVHIDQRYIQNVKPKLDKLPNITHCEDWPPVDVKCNNCGENR